MKFRGVKLPDKIRYEASDGTYGKLVIEPLERGWGTTLGNALRRVLLSSLEGAALVSVKIDGVLHEFSPIKGVVEDAVDIILNLKKLRLKLFSDGGEKIYIRREGKGEVRASDIEPNNNVEILNPELHIATLAEDGHLEMEMEVERGRGYVPAERNRKESQPIGVIPLDAAFSPVKKVKFTVENTRVGQVTDYDKLIMEVWTDRSIEPRSAIAFAARNLKDHCDLLMDFEEDVREGDDEKVEIDEEEAKLYEILYRPISDLELSVRPSNCLRDADIKTIGELVQKTDSDLLATKNFGKKSLQEIKDALSELGLELGMQIKYPRPPRTKEKAEE
jgi:DNA-directed RNA polymerase subunit alpha